MDDLETLGSMIVAVGMLFIMFSAFQRQLRKITPPDLRIGPEGEMIETETIVGFSFMRVFRVILGTVGLFGIFYFYFLAKINQGFPYMAYFCLAVTIGSILLFPWQKSYRIKVGPGDGHVVWRETKTKRYGFPDEIPLANYIYSLEHWYVDDQFAPNREAYLRHRTNNHFDIHLKSRIAGDDVDLHRKLAEHYGIEFKFSPAKAA